MKSLSPDVTVKKLVLAKRTIMKLNDDMLRRVEAGVATKPSEEINCTKPQTDSCVACQTPCDCASATTC